MEMATETDKSADTISLILLEQKIDDFLAQYHSYSFWHGNMCQKICDFFNTWKPANFFVVDLNKPSGLSDISMLDIKNMILLMDAASMTSKGRMGQVIYFQQTHIKKIGENQWVIERI